jgi:hypothetical protein
MMYLMSAATTQGRHRAVPPHAVLRLVDVAPLLAEPAVRCPLVLLMAHTAARLASGSTLMLL